MPKILIVDDEPAITMLLRAAFLRAGYEVQTAGGPQEAIKLCESETFDVLLTDVVMPAMNGHDLARWVACHHPETRTALMSGYDIKCQACAYSPRCRLLPKPFRPAEAVAFIGSLLQSAG